MRALQAQDITACVDVATIYAAAAEGLRMEDCAVSIIEATSAGFKDMADGTVRFYFDFEPRNARAAVELFRVRGTGAAIAALRDGRGAIPDTPAPKTKPGPLCIEACGYCEEPEFLEYAFDRYGIEIRTPAQARKWLCEVLGIESRKELDSDAAAADRFILTTRQPFLRWKREKQ